MRLASAVTEKFLRLTVYGSFFVLLAANAGFSAQAPMDLPDDLPKPWLAGKATEPNIYFAFRPEADLPAEQFSFVALQQHSPSDEKIKNLRVTLADKLRGKSGCSAFTRKDPDSGTETRQTWCFSDKTAVALVESGPRSLPEDFRDELLDWMREEVR